MEDPETLAARLKEEFADRLTVCGVSRGEVTAETTPEALLDVCAGLRDSPDLAFEQLMDLCGVDYGAYGLTEWVTEESTEQGFSRGVERRMFSSVAAAEPGKRFAAVYHLLSISRNQRVRLRVFAADNDFPVVNSVTGIWNSADWYEREAFDLFGIVFDGHPDLRRILTDYGFIGHPFRKDFPLSGHVAVRYDPEKRRVVYEPVEIEPRVLVPRVIREDHRYEIRPPAEKARDA
jgi:NADH-quinone oxidoreductase subunit C